MTEKPSLDGAYALETPSDSVRLYRDWAETYDESFAAAMGYDLPRAVAVAYAALNHPGPVLDLGAGTGLVAELMAPMGLDHIDGTDISQDMLDAAARKGLYKKLFWGDMTARLPVADSTYAGAVSAGTFTLGHVGPEAFDEVFRCLAPGGWFVTSINAAHWQSKGFAQKIAAMAGVIAQSQIKEVPIYTNGAGEHANDTAFILSAQKIG